MGIEFAFAFFFLFMFVVCTLNDKTYSLKQKMTHSKLEQSNDILKKLHNVSEVENNI